MAKIGQGPPPTAAAQADLHTQKGVQQFKTAAGTDVPQKVVDSFQRAGANIEAKLAGLSGTALAATLKFTNEDLALLARIFAKVLHQHPDADRRLRAKLFAKTILTKKTKGGKKSKLSRLLDEDDEDLEENDRQALEELYEMLAEQLDSTPRFAALVEEVTESVKKIR